MKEIHSHQTIEETKELFAKCSRLMMSLNTLPQPVIAKVQGLATAAGCQLVASCDLAIGSTEARFGVSGINVGLYVHHHLFIFPDDLLVDDNTLS